eukprot:1366325-Amorphochlora_amoeboformis.AAC.1
MSANPKCQTRNLSFSSSPLSSLELTLILTQSVLLLFFSTSLAPLTLSGVYHEGDREVSPPGSGAEVRDLTEEHRPMLNVESVVDDLVAYTLELRFQWM